MGMQGVSKAAWTTEWFFNAERVISLYALPFLIYGGLEDKYLWVKLELHHLAHLGLDVVGLKHNIGVLIGDFDDVHVDHTAHAGGSCGTGYG